jgi:hypothetical protein
LLHLCSITFFLASVDSYTFLSEMGFGFISGIIGDTPIALTPLDSEQEAQRLFSEMKSRHLAWRWFIELRWREKLRRKSYWGFLLNHACETSALERAVDLKSVAS